MGDASYVHVRLDVGVDIVVREDPNTSHKPGAKVVVKIDPAAIHLFDAQSGKRLGQ